MQSKKNPQGPLVVDPLWIEKQREQGWPDMYPEEFCHKCGIRNFTWVASREDWLIATSAWAKETGREGICCPACFLDMYEEATGSNIIMVVAPWRGSWEAHGSKIH